MLKHRLLELSDEIKRLREHQEFLEFLHIAPEEIKVIRAESRQ